MPEAPAAPEEATPRTGARVDLPPTDIRRKRPPALSFLLRWDTLRRLTRVLSLLALDFAGVFVAIFTALMLKAVVQQGTWAWHESFVEARQTVAFAYLVTALLFARSGLYAERAQRPGLPRIVSSLFQVTVVALIFALVNGEEYSSYYIFYGTLFFAIVYVSTIRWALREGRPACCCGRPATAAARCSSARAATSRRSTTRSSTRSTRPSTCSGSSRSRRGRTTGCARSAGSRTCRRCSSTTASRRSSSPTRTSRRSARSSSSTSATGAGSPCGSRRRRWRSCCTGRSSCPARRCRCSSCARRCSTASTTSLKRSFDFVGALLLLLVLSPLLLVIAVAVALTSRGAVLYRSIRPGIGGEPFACFKFRTMRSDADQMQADLESLNEASGALFKIRRDPRLTRVGRLLRRFSLDELPQLFNVVRGQMSLVGPRPLPQRDFDQLEDWHKKRYLVLPGMTGLWQVSGRSELDFDDLVRLDFLYLERWSVGLDLTILLKTIPAVLSRRGAF